MRRTSRDIMSLEGAMRFPSDRVRFRKDYEGHTTEEGYVILDLKGLDIDGVNQLVLDARDVRTATERGGSEREAADKIRHLLGD